ncbi:MAG TPA: dienelactone hydrolase family protein [Polyangiaceae bacterium]|nr:dienelactone hydrolase family protein [Polyangiaceae bacterium]
MESLQRAWFAGSCALVGLGCALWSCSSPSETNSGTGGRAGTGGALPTGGSPSAGGAALTAGSPATGGAPAAAGASSSSSAGTAGGDSSNGGSAGPGGAGSSVSGAGGQGGGAAGASGGTAAGGSAAGGSGGGSSIKTSPGCGSSAPLKTGNFTESIGGTNRKWMLDVPANYDASKPYRLIFVWHPLGGSGSQVASGGYNGLKSLASNTAVFATADGLSGSNSETSGTGWWNTNGGDMKLVQAMLDKINTGLCIDQDRIFSTGFSFGGMMSYTLPFEFNVFRAVAPCSGKTGVIPYTEKYTNPIPILAFHGDSDTFVATNLGKAFFDKYAARNQCGTQTQAVSPNGCVQYQGCTVSSTWCLFSGGHTTWSEQPAAIWKFFSQF